MEEEYDIFGNDPEAKSRFKNQGSASQGQQSAPIEQGQQSAPVEQGQEDKSFMDQHFGSSQNAALPFLEGLSLGWSDEALAGVLSAYGTFMPELAGGLPDQEGVSKEDQMFQNYEGIRDQIRGDTKAYSDENEMAAAGLEMAGGALTGGAGLYKAGGKQLLKEASKRGFKPDMDTIKRLAQNAGIGSVEGGIYGAGKAEDMESVPAEAAEGMAWGAGGGVAGGELMHQGRRYFQKQSALKEMLEKKIREGGDTSTALVKLQDDFKGSSKVVDDPAAMEAKAQGMDIGVIPSVKRASPLDKTQMRKMTKTAHDIIFDREKGMTMRPTDVVGDAMMRRFNIVLTANKDAGKALDGVAKDLKGKSVDFSNAVGNFQTTLWDDLGVKLVTKKGQVVPDFNPVVDIDAKTGEQLRKRSAIYGVKPAENIIKHIIGTMRQGKKLDAHDVHTMKKFIDEHVSWGTSGEGLSGKTLGIVKALRHDLDEALDSKFANYDAVNTSYKETIEVLDELQSITGKQIDLTGKRGKEALGQELRGLMSNRKRRVRLTNAIEGMENVAVKYAGRQHDDIFRLALFADELDTMFPVVARTSLAGEVKKVVKSNPKDMVLDATADMLEDYQGINEENAIQAIYKLIDSE